MIFLFMFHIKVYNINVNKITSFLFIVWADVILFYRMLQNQILTYFLCIIIRNNTHLTWDMTNYITPHIYACRIAI